MSTSRTDRIPLLFSAAVAILLLSATAPCQAQPVLDADGDPVRVGALYRLNFAGTGLGVGGLTTRQPANTTACISHIGLGELNDPGLPLLVTPGSPFLSPDGILKESVRSRIAFQTSSLTPCANQGIWTVAQVPSSLSGPFTAVVTGQQAGPQLPSAEWFEVRKAGNLERAYKLIYCNVCLPCEAFCSAELGGFVAGENVVLGVGNQRVVPAPIELPLRFVKFWNRTAVAAGTSTAASRRSHTAAV